jgi:hydrophobic/amphiphilic exporter-1 (mainly G- bacteria), HAE1 family
VKRLVELFLRRPVFTWVLVLGLVVLGATGLARMPIERFPNVDLPFVSVTIAAPGLSAEQVESELARRVEGVLGTVGGLERLDSICTEGGLMVNAQFSVDRRSTDAANEVRDRVARLTDELPPTAKPPRIETFNFNSSPIIQIGVTSPGQRRTLREVTEIADTVLRRELQGINGVGEVRLIGGETRTLTVVLDPVKLASFSLTPAEVRRALQADNLEIPGGTLLEGDADVGVRLAARARSAHELEEVVLARRGEHATRLGDVGQVQDSGVPADSRASLSGAPAVMVAVMRQPGANTVAVADALQERVAAITPRLPDGVSVRVLQDNSEDVRASVKAVAEHLILGAILAAAVVLAFLKSWRATLVAALAIPISIVGAFAVARAIGLSLNMMSLLGLTLAVGIVIDDAIVVIENIVRVMQQKKLSAREAAAEATREIGLAVFATTLSLVAVFLPVAAMEGIVGRYLAPFSLTMAVSILLSMAIAFSLTPMLCSRWLRSPGQGGATPHGRRASHGPLERLYGRALRWLLARRWVAGAGIAATLAAIVPILMAIPTSFVPVEDMSRYSVYVRLPESASVDRTASVAEEIATLSGAQPDVVDTAVSTMSAREATVTVFLGRPNIQAARIHETRQALTARFANDPYLVMVGPADDMTIAGPDGAAIQFVLRGPDLAELQALSSKLLVEAKGIPGTVDHGLTSGEGRPELSVAVDRAQIKRLGISHAEIGETIALADRKGLDLGSVRDPLARHDGSTPVRLRVASTTLGNADLVRQLTIRGEGGHLTSLGSIATVSSKLGPGVIRRVGRERQITLFMNTTPGTSDGAVVEALSKKLSELNTSGNVRGDVLGNAQEMEKTFAAFVTAVFLSFVFMYLILAAQFESWLHPITILSSLPLTVPFGLLSLLVGGQSLNLFSLLGFLVLFGVVKKNAILQVDRAIGLRREGLLPEDAIVEASLDRLRPILMTTLAFVAGMLPLVVSSGAGAATNRAIAVGILGGQTLSLALTLLAIPVVYLWMDRLAVRRASRERPGRGGRVR